MHRCNVADAAILHHYDDDVDLLPHCNVFVSLLNVSEILTFFMKHLFQQTTFSGCIAVQHVRYGKHYKRD